MQTEGAEGHHIKPCQISTQTAPCGTLSEQSSTTYLWSSKDTSRENDFHVFLQGFDARYLHLALSWNIFLTIP